MVGTDFKSWCAKNGRTEPPATFVENLDTYGVSIAMAGLKEDISSNPTDKLYTDTYRNYITFSTGKGSR